MKRIGILFLVLATVYVLSYIALSYRGKYLAGVWGLSQQGMMPKNYDWAPAGFYNPDTHERNKSMYYFFLPLYFADRDYWHTDRDYRLEPHDQSYPAILKMRDGTLFRYSPD